LNLRPPGYEPGELPDCSTPRRDGKDSIVPMPWWTWAALVFFGAAVLAAAVLVVLALLGMRRLAKTGAQVEAGLEDLARKSEELEARLAHADERAQLVERKLAHLDGSLERLSVLTWALGDVSRAVSDLRSTVMLRK
jgi:hypothetical protein